MENISKQFSIYALGGLGEVGKNMYCIESDVSIIIIDCGVLFPGADLPGVDYVIPDFTHLKNNRNKIKGLFITHGHEDHIGAIPFLIQTLHIPVIYAPRLASALIKNKLEEFRIQTKTKILEYDETTRLKTNEFQISFFRVTHSIPDSFGIVVDTSEGRIVTTGDFKVDLTPIGPDMALSTLARLGEQGVDLLLSDSTNSENEGFTPSERNVLDSINEIFINATGRLIVSTFSSNVSRIQQICEVAVKHRRKIAIIGRSMEKVVQISRSFGYIKIPDTSLIPVTDLRIHKNNELLILCTGSQGEPMAALSRIANGDHKDVTIIPGDTVVFSSSAIPGNEIMIDNCINQLTRAGAEVVTNAILSDIHSSGHPAKQELRLVLKLLKPKYFMPIHGEHRMLRIHAELAQSLGIRKENTFVMDNGDTLVLSKHKVRKNYQVEAGAVYIDGNDVNGLAKAVLDDRLKLTQDGMVGVFLAIDTEKNELMMDPVFYEKGLLGQETRDLKATCTSMIVNAINQKLSNKTNYSELKNIVKQITSDYISKKLNRSPIIIPVIMSKTK